MKETPRKDFPPRVIPSVPWTALPNPLQEVGKEALDNWAAQLSGVLVEKGVAGFADQLCQVVRLLVSQHFGHLSHFNRVEKLIRRLATGQIHDVNAPGKGRQFAVSFLEGLYPNQPFHPLEEHAWCRELSSNASIIAQELRDCSRQQPWSQAGKEACRKMSAPDWRILSLLAYGTWIAHNRFPKTKAVLESITGWRPYEVLIGNMPPHTRIGEHSDNMNFILTAHLGLQLRAGPKCSITVGDHVRQWEPGKVFVFDTSYIHSCRNETEEDRYVLVCRFWHPGCTEEERFALTLLHTLMLCIRRHGKADALFQATHETHGPSAAQTPVSH